MTPHVEIDWVSARVSGGELVVAFTDRPKAKWRTRAKASLALLERTAHEPWGAVAIKKDRIVVAGVAEGGEDDVRHFLESLVLQANGGEPAPADAQPDDADGRMTAAFQAFAPAD